MVWALVLVSWKVGWLGALEEEGHGLVLRECHQIGEVLRIGHRQRWDSKRLFGLQTQDHATGHQHFERWTGL
jgi:hypothetical protein